MPFVGIHIDFTSIVHPRTPVVPQAWTGSTVSTNESAWSAPVTGSQALCVKWPSHTPPKSGRGSTVGSRGMQTGIVKWGYCADTWQPRVHVTSGSHMWRVDKHCTVSLTQGGVNIYQVHYACMYHHPHWRTPVQLKLISSTRDMSVPTQSLPCKPRA